MRSNSFNPAPAVCNDLSDTTTETTRKNKVKKQPWHWNSILRIAFDNVKTTIAKEVVLAYPDFTKSFDIYTDASTKQLGSVITQDTGQLRFSVGNSLTRNPNTPLPNWNS